jgi:hypothetical protein
MAGWKTMKLSLTILVSFLMYASSAQAKDAYAHYEIDSQEWGLFGYYVSDRNRPHFLAVFRPNAEQPSDPEQFNFDAACEAVLVSPPKIDGVPLIEPTGGVVFFQVVQTRMLVFSTNISSFIEFDVSGGECSVAEPNSIYTPTPGFTPGISN